MYIRSSYQFLILAASLAATVSGIKVPKGQPDGTYEVIKDSNGTEYHTRISQSKPSKRQISWPKGTEPQCGGGGIGGDVVSLPQLDWSSADARFVQACTAAGDTHFQDTEAVYSVSGQAVVYYCNYNHKGGTTCEPDEYSAGKSVLQATCNHAPDGVQAARWNIPSWKKAYGWQTSNTDFC
ncbi:hypothetical protein F5Y04DRAFT_292117 [Hypomontagnella monticulosa]|nr:hypothetical protein F5Y04DRAFT_292117 [Hypomontagnella monticulosa]